MINVSDRKYLVSEIKKLKSFSKNDNLVNILDQHLEAINRLNYSNHFLNDQIVDELISVLLQIVPVSNENLVIKFCWVILNTLNRQKLVLTNSACNSASFLLSSLKFFQSPSTFTIILRGLATVIYQNVHQLTQVNDQLIETILHFCTATNESIFRSALQCLENITFRTTPECEYLSEQLQIKCIQFILEFLRESKQGKINDITYSRILISALQSLGNLLLAVRPFPVNYIASVISIIQVYILYDHTENFSSYLSEIKNLPAGASIDEAIEETNSRKKKSKRRHKKLGNIQPSIKLESDEDQESQNIENTQNENNDNQRDDSFWNNYLQRSDSSDCSDLENVKVDVSQVKVRAETAKVRLQALACFHAAVKNIEKKTMFGYWTSFFQDNSREPSESSIYKPLFYVVMKDPSFKVRAACINVIACLIDGSKSMLVAAEECVPHVTLAYTPFSITLGGILLELHRCLLLLIGPSVNNDAILLQTIKCLTKLVENCPYAKLRPGLITKVAKQVRYHLPHRDGNIRSACLTCLTSIVSIQPISFEVSQLLQPNQGCSTPSAGGESSLSQIKMENESFDGSLNMDHDRRVDLDKKSGLNGEIVTSEIMNNAQQIENFTGLKIFKESYDNNETVELFSKDLSSHRGCVQSSVNDSKTKTLKDDHSRIVKSGLDNQIDAHNGSDCNLENNSYLNYWEASSFQQSPTPPSTPVKNVKKEMPWMLKLCIRLIQPSLLGERKLGPDCGQQVKVEALKLVGQLVLMYINLHRNYFDYVKKLIMECLNDNDEIVQLHSIRVLKCLTESLSINSSFVSENNILGTSLWLDMLSGPINSIMQKTKDPIIKSTVLNCFTHLNATVFDQLPDNMGRYCITMLLGNSSDGNASVRTASVQAIGYLLLIPSLGEDTGFIIDAADSILKCCEDKTLSVKMQATWSISNLSEVLALQNSSSDRIPSGLILKIMKVGLDLTKSEKLRSNAVRSIGFILKYLSADETASPVFYDVINQSIDILVNGMTHGIPKSRWNCCYALGNSIQNPNLISFLKNSKDFIPTLVSTLHSSNNTKVRIAATHTITEIPDRGFFQNHFESTLAELVHCLSLDEGVYTTGPEINHKNNLIKHLSRAIIKMIRLLSTTEETSKAAYLFWSNEVAIKKSISMVMVQENVEVASLVSKFKSLKPTTINNEEDINYFTNFFSFLPIDFELKSVEKESTIKSHFRQTFD